jgi:hypothetical protein
MMVPFLLLVRQSTAWMTVTFCGVREYSRLSRAAIQDPRGLSSLREQVCSLGAPLPAVVAKTMISTS